MTVAKPELGTKRLCQNCGAKFYDLNRDPILCPKCGAPFLVSAGRTAPVVATAAEDETDAETDVVEIVSLDDVADSEEAAVKTGDEDIDIGDDDIPDDDDEATFLADEDEENDDVADLIDGDIESDDEN